MINNNSVLIAGLGISGFEAALLALKNDYSVTVIDSGDGETLQTRAEELHQKGCYVQIGSIPTFKEFIGTIVISPGIHPQSPLGSFVHSLNAPVISEIEFAAKFTSIPLIGVTGTNGKTTTVELITHCLNTLGCKAIAAGNIGLALSRVIRENKPWDFIVVEVSSFQLENVDKLAFAAGALLNISSDHVDRYKNLQEYAETKKRLLDRSQIKVTSARTLEAGWLNRSNDLYIVATNDTGDTSTRLQGEELLVDGLSFDYSQHPLQGKHNAENLLTAITLLKELNFTVNDIYKASLSYTPAKHRMQHFLTWNDICFINDSKATNPDSMKMALESLGEQGQKNIVLIAGGRDKKMDFNIVNTALCSYVRTLLIYGECRNRLSEVWSELTSCIVCDDFAEAVNRALNTVKEGDILLLSPGCSSLDSFSSYTERGNYYMKSVQEWTENERKND